MINVLCVTPVDEEHQKLFSDIDQVCIRFIDREHVTEEDIDNAEVILGGLPMSRLGNRPNLKWLQLDWAGAVLMVMKNLANYIEVQKNHDSTNLGSVNTLTSSTVLSVGMGDIGSSFAKKMHALGAKVYGVRRSFHGVPDYAEGMYTMDNMDEILPECDVVALSLPETEETVHLFDEARLRKIKKGAILVNVGRGTAIVTEDLLRVVKDGHFSGVCLDVTDPEDTEWEHKPLSEWVYEHFDLIPAEGDSFEWNGLRVTVTGLLGRRIRTVRVEKIVPAPTEGGADS